MLKLYQIYGIVFATGSSASSGGSEGGGSEGGGTLPGEEEEAPEDVACFDPANIGKIGTEGICKDMLIVSRAMMLNDATPVSGGQDMAIVHADSGRTFYTSACGEVFCSAYSSHQ